MEEKKEIAFRILRYDPHLDSEPYFDNFKVPVEKGITVLRALNYIKDNLEPQLTFRAFCQAGICGSCAMRINGVAKLACMTQVWTEVENSKQLNTIQIEPIANLDIIRDLVVDMDPVVGKLKEYYSWVQPTKPKEEFGEKEHLISEEDFQEYEQATDCILCASCLSECMIQSTNREYISPLILIRAYRMNVDERDGLKDERLRKVLADHGVWDCTHCYKCVEHCVKNIDIMKGIHGLRQQAFETGRGNSEGGRHARAFYDDIKSKGRLMEATLPIRTLGLIKSIVMMVPDALKMSLKGRVPLPPFFISAIPGISSVRRIYRALKKKKGSK